MKRWSWFILLAILAATSANSQNTKADTVNAIRNSSNQAGGSYRDVLTSFFQMAYQDLTSNKKEFKFSSNIFAIKLKTDSNLNVDTAFVNQTWARNSNVDFSLKLDSNWRFNGMKFGYTYAIVNKRDYAVAKSFNTAILNKSRDYTDAFESIVAEISLKYGDGTPESMKLIEEMNKFFNSTDFQFKSLSPDGKTLVKTFFYKPEFDFKDSWNPRVDMKDIYNAVVKDYQKKLLWTFSGNTATYKDGFVFSNINLYTEATAGMIPINDRNNIEFYVKANYSFEDDTLKAKRDLKRNVFTSKFGLNWVCRNKLQKSVFEFKAAGELDHIPSGKYVKENRTKFVFDADLRFRITNEIWFPITIKYEPKEGNWFGFISVKSNFDLLNKVFGFLK